jgi:hypothetical protein
MSTATLRRWHSYIGLFMAPSLIFFALTGAVQIFNLHEAHGDYKPALLLEKLSAVHKDQVFAPPHEHSPPAGAQPAAPDLTGHQKSDDDEDEHTSLPTLALKVFFLLIALGVVASSSIGIWMGFTQLRRSPVAWWLLAVGALIPVGLLLL